MADGMRDSEIIAPEVTHEHMTQDYKISGGRNLVLLILGALTLFFVHSYTISKSASIN